MVSSPGSWVVTDDHQLTSKNNGLIEALIEPVIGFADATIGGTSIRPNMARRRPGS